MAITPNEARMELAKRELAKRELARRQQPTPFSEGWYKNNFKKTEQNIAGRTDMMNQGIGDIVNHPVKTAMFPQVASAKMLLGAGQRIGSAVFNPLIKQQTDTYDPNKNPFVRTGELLGESAKALTGERLGQMSDLMTNVGVPEQVATPAGAVGEAVLMAGPEGLKNIYQGGKALVKATKEGLPQLMKSITSKLPGVTNAKNALKTETQLGGIQKSLDIDSPFLKKKDILNKLDEAMNLHVQNDLVPKFKSGIAKISKDFSESYGKRLDVVDEAVIESGQGLTGADARTIIENAKNEIIDFLGKEVDPLTDSTYRSLVNLEGQYANIADDASISLRQFKSDGAKIWSPKSSSAKAGASYQPQDVPSKIFKSSWGEYIADKAKDVKGFEDFQKLQEESRPVLQAIKFAGKKFKPFANENEQVQGAKYLLDYAKSRASGAVIEQQQKFMDTLQKGNNFFKGLGDLTEELVQKAKDADQIETMFKQAGDLRNLNKELLKKYKNVLTVTGLAGGAVYGATKGLGSLLHYMANQK